MWCVGSTWLSDHQIEWSVRWWNRAKPPLTSAPVHPAVMGTWWNETVTNCSVATPAEVQVHFSVEENETVKE